MPPPLEAFPPEETRAEFGKLMDQKDVILAQFGPIAAQMKALWLFVKESTKDLTHGSYLPGDKTANGKKKGKEDGGKGLAKPGPQPTSKGKGRVALFQLKEAKRASIRV